MNVGNEVVATVDAGAVVGIESEGVRRFLGIPYAAPPYGRLRFALPERPAAWPGRRDATTMGPTPPQDPYPGELGHVLPSVIIPGDDILNVNVWSPSDPAADGRGHPVMVWIPGGALTRGSNALAIYDGTSFARHGVVLVAMNYRLGAEGFAVLEDAPSNRGLADQVAALEWVQRNIAAFGGDPDRVTVFGQSAGGSCIAALMASPAANGLFSRTIIQSAPIPRAPDPGSLGIASLMADDLGIAPTRAAFAAQEPDALVAAQAHVSGSTPLAGGPAFEIVVDDRIVTSSPAEALAASVGADIPLVIGGTAEESRLWFALGGLGATITEPVLQAAAVQLHVAPAELDEFRRARGGASPGDVLGAVLTDRLVSRPADQLADARLNSGLAHPLNAGGRTWRYRFGWPSPVHDLGAAHGVDVPFVFNTLDTPAGHALTGHAAPADLAHEMHGSWVRFATHGTPGWEPWSDDGRPIMEFA